MEEGAGKVTFGERFLRVPALCPRRIAGEPHGRHSMSIEFAGTVHRLRGLSRDQLEAVAERWGDLIRSDRSGVCTDTRIFRASRNDFLDIDTRGWEYSLDFEYAPDVVSVAGPGWMAHLRLDRPLRCGLWTRPSRSDEFAGPLENFLRILLAYLLLTLGGALIHSAAVVDRERAFVFFGHSGAGKTTVARLSVSEGLTVLSDDMNALLPSEGSVRVHEVPFAGDFAGDGTGRTFPAQALIRLRQDSCNRLENLGRAETAAGLISCAPFVNRDPYRALQLAARLEDLAGRVPAHTLMFAREGGFWPLLRGR